MKTATLVLVGICAIALGGRLLGEEDSPVLRELGDAKLENCGVDVTLFLLGWFNVPVGLERLQNELGVGPHWAKATSLAQIKSALERRGLKVDAYKDARVDEVLPRIDGKQVCVLHVQRDDSPVGHFYLVVARRLTEVFLVDAGTRQDWVPIQEFNEKLGKSFTGYCLFISQANPNPQPEHTLDEKIIEVDVGTITNSPGILLVTIPVVNTKQVPIVVEKASGSCGCFNGAGFRGERPTRLEPGEKQVLELRFDRASIGVGDVRRAATLSVKDTEAREVQIKITAHVFQLPVEQRVTWFPQKIDYGLVKDTGTLLRPQDVAIWLPPGVMLGSITPSSSNVLAKVLDKQENVEGDDQVPRRAYRLEVSITATRNGPFNEKVSITTSDTNYPLVEIPLVGEVTHQ
jgi:hypothetical protein